MVKHRGISRQHGALQPTPSVSEHHPAKRRPRGARHASAEAARGQSGKASRATGERRSRRAARSTAATAAMREVAARIPFAHQRSGNWADASDADHARQIVADENAFRLRDSLVTPAYPRGGRLLPHCMEDGTSRAVWPVVPSPTTEKREYCGGLTH